MFEFCMVKYEFVWFKIVFFDGELGWVLGKFEVEGGFVIFDIGIGIVEDIVKCIWIG